jgi:hypothetical protein
MSTSYGRYGATYNMVGFTCINEELLLLPKNPTEAKLQAMSTRGESTEPTKGVMKHTLTHLQSCTIKLLPDAILLYLVLSTCEQRRVQSESMGKGIQIHEFQFHR